MVGYGPEDSHFVVELTYNYNISNYKLGNDFQVKLVFNISNSCDNTMNMFKVVYKCAGYHHTEQ